MGKHLALEERLDSAFFQERHLLRVAQVRIGLVLDASPGLLADDGRSVGIRAALRPKGFNLLRGVDTLGIDARDAERAFDGDLPVAERGVGKNLGLLGFRDVEKSVGDLSDLSQRQLAVLLTQVLAQRSVDFGGVDELDFSLWPLPPMRSRSVFQLLP